LGIFSSYYAKCCKLRFQEIGNNIKSNYQVILDTGTRVLAAVGTGGLSEVTSVVSFFKAIVDGLGDKDQVKRLACLLTVPDGLFNRVIHSLQPFPSSPPLPSFNLREPSRQELSMVVLDRAAAQLRKKSNDENPWLKFGGSVTGLLGVDVSSLQTVADIGEGVLSLAKYKDALQSSIAGASRLQPLNPDPVTSTSPALTGDQAALRDLALRRQQASVAFDAAASNSVITQMVALELGDFYCQGLQYWAAKSTDPVEIGGVPLTNLNSNCNKWKTVFASVVQLKDAMLGLSWDATGASCDTLIAKAAKN